MSPDELLQLFEQTREDFRDLVSDRRHELPVYVHGQLQGKDVRVESPTVWYMEASTRLGQSHFALAQFRELDAKTPRPNDLAPALLAGLFQPDHMDRMQFFAEAFYYFAWRFSQVIDNNVRLRARDGKIVRPFKDLDPVGIRQVRNQLIEHPEKADGQNITHFTFNCPEGLILEYGQTNEIDQGLYPNAEELIMKVRARIARFKENRS